MRNQDTKFVMINSSDKIIHKVEYRIKNIFEDISSDLYYYTLGDSNGTSRL